MKASIFKVVSLGCMVVLVAQGCNNSVKEKEPEVQNAKANLDSAEQSLQQARIDSANEASYRAGEEAKLKENNKKIAELKESIKKENRKVNKQYHEDLDKLSYENAKLDSSLNRFSESGKQKWDTFKYNFDREMDSIGKSISRLAKKNKQ